MGGQYPSEPVADVSGLAYAPVDRDNVGGTDNNCQQLARLERDKGRKKMYHGVCNDATDVALYM